MEEESDSTRIGGNMVFEAMNKKRWLTLALIVLAITVLRTMVQPFIPETGSSPFPPSVFVQSGLMPVAFVVYGLVMLGLLALVFLLLQGALPGTKLVKGLTFSVSFGLLWFLALLEPLPHGSWHMPEVFYYPLVDGITLSSLGILMGLFIFTDSPPRKRTHISPGILALAAFPLLFLAGRLLSYNVSGIYSSYAARPFDTLLWVVATGLWIGCMYFLLRPGMGNKSPPVKAAYFGIIVFGINIFLNDMFMPIPFELKIWEIGAFSYADLVVRAGTDIIFVVAGVYVCEKILQVLGDRSSGKNESRAGEMTG